MAEDTETSPLAPLLRAISRLESALNSRPPRADTGDLHRKHERLKSEVAAIIQDIDTVLGARRDG